VVLQPTRQLPDRGTARRSLCHAVATTHARSHYARRALLHRARAVRFRLHRQLGRDVPELRRRATRTSRTRLGEPDGDEDTAKRSATPSVRSNEPRG
jgi:hypothetical protein